LTKEAEGKHHLAHFLPVEEQQKFFEALAKSRSAKEAEPSTSGLQQQKEDFVENKLQNDNVGM